MTEKKDLNYFLFRFLIDDRCFVRGDDLGGQIDKKSGIFVRRFEIGRTWEGFGRTASDISGLSGILK